VLTSLRKSIGVEHAAPALFSLPTTGSLLVRSGDGPWIVQADGEKRLLDGWRDASWSPHGRYVLVTRANGLGALDPTGHVRWTLARPHVRVARWGGTAIDTRIAYLSGTGLRVVAGDGTGDRAACADGVATVAPAWRPGAVDTVAFAAPDGTVVAYAADTCKLLWRSAPIPALRALEWTSNGTRLLAVTRSSVDVLARGTTVAQLRQHVVAAAPRPGTDELATITVAGGTSELRVGRRVVFRGSGRFAGVEWSPDGKWLLVTWPTADQWVFVRVTGPRRIVGVANIRAQFGGGSFPSVEGWCCSAR
jgi:hypothetical protein